MKDSKHSLKPDETLKIDFLNQINVSRETLEKLEIYSGLLVDWQTKMNLVANSTIETLWIRHMLDSAQVIHSMPVNTKKMVDLGSGAGFPALVVAILAKEFGFDFEIVLVESDKKKCLFLNEVVSKCGLNVSIIPERIEQISPLNADLITSRALAPLQKLLQYSFSHITKYGVCLFLKGQNVVEELKTAEQNWTFKKELIQSISDKSGTILRLSDIKKLKSKSSKKE